MPPFSIEVVIYLQVLLVKDLKSGQSNVTKQGPLDSLGQKWLARLKIHKKSDGTNLHHSNQVNFPREKKKSKKQRRGIGVKDAQ